MRPRLGAPPSRLAPWDPASFLLPNILWFGSSQLSGRAGRLHAAEGEERGEGGEASGMALPLGNGRLLLPSVQLPRAKGAGAGAMLPHDPWSSCWHRPAAAPGAWQGPQAGKAGHGLSLTNRAAPRAFACARRTGSDSHWRRLCFGVHGVCHTDMPWHATHLTISPGGDVSFSLWCEEVFRKEKSVAIGLPSDLCRVETG
jgi:hypothetical protein